MRSCVFAALVVLLLVQATLSLPPPPMGRDEDYMSDTALESLLGRNAADKRSCVRRGGGCDSSPQACCPESACRCNLWGTNCRCERQGLLQQWGRRK